MPRCCLLDIRCFRRSPPGHGLGLPMCASSQTAWPSRPKVSVSVQGRVLLREGRSHPWWSPMFCSTLETAGQLVTLTERGRCRESEDLQRLPLFRPRMRAHPHAVRQARGLLAAHATRPTFVGPIAGLLMWKRDKQRGGLKSCRGAVMGRNSRKWADVGGQGRAHEVHVLPTIHSYEV